MYVREHTVEIHIINILVTMANACLFKQNSKVSVSVTGADVVYTIYATTKKNNWGGATEKFQ